MRMKGEKEDFFDVILSCRLFRPIYPVYKKYREGLLYLFFGGITVALSVTIFVLMNVVIKIDVLIANIISWSSGVVFSFFVTRRWVFRSKEKGFRATVVQMGQFGSARLATLLLQELLLYIFVTQLGYRSMVVKICTEVINIILNYLVSKFLIFRRG